MSYTATFKKLEKGEVMFEGEITAEKFESYRKEAVENLGRDLEIPGFRKGKAPNDVIEKNISEMVILEEMANRAISEVYLPLLKEHSVDAIGHPKISITKIAKGNPLNFSITTATMPKIELPDYKKIAKENGKQISVEITDDEVEKTIMEIRKSRAPKKPMEPHEHKEGEEHSHEEEIDMEKLPELTDDFVKALGNFENVQDFKNKLKENIKLEKEHREHEKNRLTIMEKVLEATKAEIPDVLINGELDRMLYRMKADISQMGISFDDYMKHLGKSEEVMKEEFRTDAEKRVKMEIVIDSISKAESIVPDEKKVEEEMERLMKEYPGADKDRAKVYIEQVLVNEEVFKKLEAQGK
jgi:FKBP-type peptidyl-prolyl cis-trans isomerase (trigger factor)